MKASALFFSSLIAAAAMSTVPAWAAMSLTNTTTTVSEDNEYGIAAGTYSGNIIELTAAGSTGFHDGTYTVYKTDSDGALSVDKTGVNGTDESTALTNNGTAGAAQTLWYYFAGSGASVNGTYGETLYVSADTLANGNLTANMTFGPAALGGLIVGASDNTFETGRTGTDIQMQFTGASGSGVVFNIGSNTKLHAGNGFVASGTQNWTIASGKTLSLLNSSTGSGTLTVNSGSTISIPGGGTVSVGTLSGAGTVDLGSAGAISLSGTSKFSNWTGTVKLADRGTGYDSNLTLGNFGTSNSTIELSGIMGYFKDSSVAANLVLKNSSTREYAVKLMNGSSGGTLTFSGSVSGDGTFRHAFKTGTTNVTQSYKFTGDLSAFTGNFETEGDAAAGDLIFGNGGVSVAGEGESVSGTGTINWKSGKKDALGVVYSYSDDVFAKNTIEGSSTKLVKQGAGSLTLTGANTYTGGTTVSAGTLIAGSTSAFGAGALTVNSGASVSANGNAVDLGTGAITINGSYIVTTGGSLATSGAITFGSTGTLDITNLESGTYTIFGGTGTVSGLSISNVTKVSGRDKVEFTEDYKSFTLTTGAAYDLTWSSATGTWDTSTTWTNNTAGGEENPTFADGDTVTFAASDTAAKTISIVGAKEAQAVNVTGGDYAFSAGTDGSLAVRGALTVSSGASLALSDRVLGTVSGGISLESGAKLNLSATSIGGLTNVVSGSGTVVLTGDSSERFISTAGVLTGDIAVEKTGTGKVTINTAQSYTGGTTISQGNLGVGNNNALGTGTITLNGGQITAQADSLNFDNAVVIGENGGTINTQGQAMTLSGKISGTGTLTKAGSGATGGTLILTNASFLNGTSVFAPKMIVSAGTLQFGSGSTIAIAKATDSDGGIEVGSGATLYLSGVSSTHHSIAKDITLNEGASLKWNDASQASDDSYQHQFTGALTVNGSAVITGVSNWAKEVALLGNLSGSGTLNYYRGAGDSAFNSNGRLIIAGADNSGFTGTVLIGGQSTAYSQGLDLNADLANGTISLQGNTTSQPAYMRVLKSATIKGLNGNANSSIGIGNVLANGAVGNYTLTVGEGTFAGTIEDNGYARQYGATGDKVSKVSGATLALVKNTTGTLTLSGNNTFTGGVTVEAGTLVAGSASALGTGKVSVAKDAKLGLIAGTTVKNVTGGVELAEGAKLVIDMTGQTASSAVEDTLALNLVVGSALKYNGNAFAVDCTTLITEGVVVLDNLDSSLTSWVKKLSYASDTSTLTLTMTIPEPSTFGLLAGVGALALVAARRRRRAK